jgi:hypothetical protein
MQVRTSTMWVEDVPLHNMEASMRNEAFLTIQLGGRF